MKSILKFIIIFPQKRAVEIAVFIIAIAAIPIAGPAIGGSIYAVFKLITCLLGGLEQILEEWLEE